MRLLKLSSGRASLEFQIDEFESIRSKLRDFGPVESKMSGICTVLSVAKEELVYYNEWDEPCLISGSVEGDRILGEIAQSAIPSRSSSITVA